MEEAANSMPISNQKLKLDFYNKQTDVFVGEQEAEYLKIQKFYRIINEFNPNLTTKVFVHCAMGMSRSATSVIMYIMKQFHMSMEDALEFVKTQREETDPNDGFLEQLKRFEENNFQFLNEEDIESNESPLDSYGSSSENPHTPSDGGSNTSDYDRIFNNLGNQSCSSPKNTRKGELKFFGSHNDLISLATTSSLLPVKEESEIPL